MMFLFKLSLLLRVSRLDVMMMMTVLTILHVMKQNVSTHVLSMTHVLHWHCAKLFPTHQYVHVPMDILVH